MSLPSLVSVCAPITLAANICALLKLVVSVCSPYIGGQYVSPLHWQSMSVPPFIGGQCLYIGGIYAILHWWSVCIPLQLSGSQCTPLQTHTHTQSLHVPLLLVIIESSGIHRIGREALVEEE